MRCALIRTAAGKIRKLKDWWNALVSLCPKFGYHVNASKTHLITKKCHRATADAVFGDTAVFRLVVQNYYEHAQGV